MIIHNIYRIVRFIVEFLRRSRRSWCVKEQIGLGATLIYLVFIEKSEKDETME
jgi:hypothetical protein